jgi:WD40 repeat protein
MDAGHSEILQLHFFKRNSNLLVAVASVESAIKTYDIRGNNVPFPGQMWGIHMAFCSEAPLWAYLGDAERESRVVGPEYHNRDDFYVKRPSTHMYNHITGAKLHTMNSVYAKPLAFSSLGSHFAVSKPGGRMMVMHASGHSAPSKHVISCFHTDDVTHAVFTPDAHGLVTISRDGTIRMIDPNTGESLAKLDVDTWKQPQFLGMTPDGNVIVSIWGDTVYRWDYNTGSLDTYVLHTRRQRDGRPIAISADCRFLACSTHDGVDVSDLHSGRLLHTLRFQGGYATAAAFSPDGKYLALGKSAGGLLRVTKATVDIWELVF